LSESGAQCQQIDREKTPKSLVAPGVFFCSANPLCTRGPPIGEPAKAFPEDPAAARRHIQKEQRRAQRRSRSLLESDAPQLRNEKVTRSA